MKELVKNLFYLFLPIILGTLVGFFISGSIDYSELIKPPFAPPNYLFPIVWTIIYLLMGISYFLLKRNKQNTKIVSLLYYLQLGVNLLWSVIFFTLKLSFLACIWIILLDVLVIIMIFLFSKKYKISACLNIPYLIWILFATYLTIGIFILN